MIPFAQIPVTEEPYIEEEDNHLQDYILKPNQDITATWNINGFGKIDEITPDGVFIRAYSIADNWVENIYGMTSADGIFAVQKVKFDCYVKFTNIQFRVRFRYKYGGTGSWIYSDWIILSPSGGTTWHWASAIFNAGNDYPINPGGYGFDEDELDTLEICLDPRDTFWWHSSLMDICKVTITAMEVAPDDPSPSIPSGTQYDLSPFTLTYNWGTRHYKYKVQVDYGSGWVYWKGSASTWVIGSPVSENYTPIYGSTKNYKFRVISANSDDVPTDWVETPQTRTVSVPTTPTWNTPSCDDEEYDGDILVTWNDVTGETGYEIWRGFKPHGGDYGTDGWLHDEEAAGAGNHTDTSATSHGTYRYKIRAYNDVGYGNFSAYHECSMNAPATITDCNSGIDQSNTTDAEATFNVSISWTKSATQNITHNIIERYKTSWSVIDAEYTGASPYADNGRPAGAYKYRITPVNAIGEGQSSNEDEILLSTIPLPPVVDEVTPNPSYDGDFWVNWSDVTTGYPGVTTYGLDRWKESTGTWTNDYQTGLTESNYYESGLGNDTYRYRAKATNSVGDSDDDLSDPYSNVVEVRVASEREIIKYYAGQSNSYGGETYELDNIEVFMKYMEAPMCLADYTTFELLFAENQYFEIYDVDNTTLLFEGYLDEIKSATLPRKFTFMSGASNELNEPISYNSVDTYYPNGKTSGMIRDELIENKCDWIKHPVQTDYDISPDTQLEVGSVALQVITLKSGQELSADFSGGYYSIYMTSGDRVGEFFNIASNTQGGGTDTITIASGIALTDIVSPDKFRIHEMGRDVTQDSTTLYKKKFDNIPLVEIFFWADEVTTQITTWMPNGRDIWHDGDVQLLDDDDYKKAYGIIDWGTSVSPDLSEYGVGGGSMDTNEISASVDGHDEVVHNIQDSTVWWYRDIGTGVSSGSMDCWFRGAVNTKAHYIAISDASNNWICRVIFNSDGNIDFAGTTVDGDIQAYSATTWYHVRIDFLRNGTCELFINGTSISTVTGQNLADSDYIFRIDVGSADTEYWIDAHGYSGDYYIPFSNLWDTLYIDHNEGTAGDMNKETLNLKVSRVIILGGYVDGQQIIGEKIAGGEDVFYLSTYKRTYVFIKDQTEANNLALEIFNQKSQGFYLINPTIISKGLVVPGLGIAVGWELDGNPTDLHISPAKLFIPHAIIYKPDEESCEITALDGIYVPEVEKDALSEENRQAIADTEEKLETEVLHNDGGTMEGDVTFDDSLIMLNSPSGNGGIGQAILGTLATGVTAFKCVRFDGTDWELCDADSPSTWGTCSGISLEAEGSNKKIFIWGRIKNSGWSFTAGNDVYVGDGGTPTTDISGFSTGDYVQRIGKALSTTEMLFLNDTTVIKKS